MLYWSGMTKEWKYVEKPWVYQGEWSPLGSPSGLPQGLHLPWYTLGFSTYCPILCVSQSWSSELKMRAHLKSWYSFGGSYPKGIHKRGGWSRGQFCKMSKRKELFFRKASLNCKFVCGSAPATLHCVSFPEGWRFLHKVKLISPRTGAAIYYITTIIVCWAGGCCC